MRKQIVKKELLLSLPNEVKSMKLPPKANEIYCHLFAFADKDGMCYSTIEGLSKELNCSKTTIITSLKLLEIKKLILERVIGKRGTATTFKIKLFNSTESCNDTVSLNDTESFDSTESLNNKDTECSTNSTECNNSTNNSTECSTELKTFIEEVITLKMNELKNEILNELRCIFNTNSTIIQNKINKIKIKQSNNKVTNTNSSYNIQEVNNTDIDNNLNNIENIEINKKEDINKKENKDLNINESIDKSTCMYKRRKQNDYQYTAEDENDYNPIVENTKVEGIVSKSDGNTSKSKKFLYSLKGSTLKFSYFEALEYVSKNDLNFDECFEKVEVLV